MLTVPGLSPRVHWPALLLALIVGIAIAVLPLQLAIGLFAGVAFLILILLQPLFGLAVALLAGPWAALEAIALGFLPMDSGQILLALTIAAWLAWGVARRRIMLRYTALTVPFALFLIAAAISLLGAPSLSHGLREFLKWGEIGLVMVIVVDLVVSSAQKAREDNEQERFGQALARHRRPLQAVVAMVLLAGLSQALIGIWQFGLRGTGPEHFIILEDFYRAYGTFEQPNPFGGFMGLVAALSVGVFLGLLMSLWLRFVNRLRLRRSKLEPEREPETTSFSWLWFLFVGLCAAACTFALLLSWSRGAWLGFAVGMAVLILFWPRRRVTGVLLLLAGLLLFLVSVQMGVVPASITERLVSFQQDIQFGDVRGVDINDANYAVIERLAHWQSALEMARAQPWFGVGIGNYEPAYPEYALINWPYPLGHAHNFYLNILAETGVVGAFAYLLLWAFVLGQTIWLLRRLPWPERGIALGLLAAWIALSVHHLLDNLYVNNVFLHLGVMLGILQVLVRLAGEPKRSPLLNQEKRVTIND